VTAPLPRAETRAWWSILVAFDVADSLRSLRLPCAARCATTDATAEAWREISTELAQLAHHEGRAHLVKSLRVACSHMADREPIAAADALKWTRDDVDSLGEWARKVAAEVEAARLSGGAL
jgi:hypothetical protein